VQDLSAFPLAPLNESNSDSENAYHAGLTFLYGLNSSVFTRVSRSFRFPLVDELVVYDFDTGQIRANPDLKPQTGIHSELGVRHHFTPKLRANLTLFRAEIEDEIFSTARCSPTKTTPRPFIRESKWEPERKC
jgi:outer membrane receptor protein involved in Fe transport